ncbi:MAG: patatin-like phospholipase family protein [Gammaproteobacteria bacterium]|nr:patatin-like phospholipase family protein [Gammaproteobacteria bacterium]
MAETRKPLTLSRREFLLFSAAGLAVACSGCDRKPGLPRIGLALGGGGAKGLAHILVLETLDELGIRPHVISGTSIGAIIGALYAAGLSGSEIRAQIEQFFVDQGEAENKLFALPKSVRWLDFIDPALAAGGLLDSSDFIAWLGEVLPTTRFRRLEIPLKVVTAELLTGKQVVIDSGDLLPALQASMAVPGVFPPVEWQGRTLVDGGVANPLPYDLVQADCDLVIAVDVSGSRDLEDGEMLSSLGVLLQSFHTMSNNILAEKLKLQRPAIYIRPDIRNVKVLEFYKARQIFAQAQPAQQQLVKALRKALRGYAGRPGCTQTWL